MIHSGEFPTDNSIKGIRNSTGKIAYGSVENYKIHGYVLFYSISKGNQGIKGV